MHDSLSHFASRSLVVQEIMNHVLEVHIKQTKHALHLKTCGIQATFPAAYNTILFPQENKGPRQPRAIAAEHKSAL